MPAGEYPGASWAAWQVELLVTSMEGPEVPGWDLPLVAYLERWLDTQLGALLAKHLEVQLVPEWVAMLDQSCNNIYYILANSDACPELT